MKLYRVILTERDNSARWDETVLYCGYDTDEARRVYHANEIQDGYRFRDNCNVVTKIDVLDTDDLDEDDMGEMSDD